MIEHVAPHNLLPEINLFVQFKYIGFERDRLWSMYSNLCQ